MYLIPGERIIVGHKSVLAGFCKLSWEQAISACDGDKAHVTTAKELEPNESDYTVDPERPHIRNYTGVPMYGSTGMKVQPDTFVLRKLRTHTWGEIPGLVIQNW